MCIASAGRKQHLGPEVKGERLRRRHLQRSALGAAGRLLGLGGLQAGQPALLGAGHKLHAGNLLFSPKCDSESNIYTAVSSACTLCSRNMVLGKLRTLTPSAQEHRLDTVQ